MRELLTVGKLWELAQLDRRTPGADAYDLVVVDAPGDRPRRRGARRRRARSPRPPAAGPVARQGRIIDAMLSDPAQTAVVAVARAEELPVTETGALRDALRERMGLALERVVANALDPDRFSAARGDAAARRTPAHPAVARALRGHRRALRQRAQLARLRRAHRPGAGARCRCTPAARTSSGSPTSSAAQLR